MCLGEGVFLVTWQIIKSFLTCVLTFFRGTGRQKASKKPSFKLYFNNSKAFFIGMVKFFVGIYSNL